MFVYVVLENVLELPSHSIWTCELSANSKCQPISGQWVLLPYTLGSH